MSNVNLDYIFRYNTATRLPADEEETTVRAAQAGDPDAFMAVLDAHGPLLRKYAAQAAKWVDTEEAQAEILLEFTNALMAYDKDSGRSGGQIAGLVQLRLKEAVMACRLSALSVDIPRKTYLRYRQAVDAANGDVNAARESAPSFDLSRDTFDAIHAVLGATSLDVQEADAAPVADRAASLYVDESRTTATVREEAREALDAIADDATATRIVHLAYGFGDDEVGLYYDAEPLSDEGVADVMKTSRPTIQRKRKAALVQMRKALIVTHA